MSSNYACPNPLIFRQLVLQWLFKKKIADTLTPIQWQILAHTCQYHWMWIGELAEKMKDTVRDKNNMWDYCEPLARLGILETKHLKVQGKPGRPRLYIKNVIHYYDEDQQELSQFREADPTPSRMGIYAKNRDEVIAKKKQEEDKT